MDGHGGFLELNGIEFEYLYFVGWRGLRGDYKSACNYRIIEFTKKFRKIVIIKIKYTLSEPVNMKLNSVSHTVYDC